PLFDHDESVGTEFGERAPVSIDGSAVLDAALLGMHGRHIGLEVLQHLFALSGLGSDDGDDVDHSLLPWNRLDIYAARPWRSRRPDSFVLMATASLPSRRITWPLTITAKIPCASDTSRSAPAGRS